METLGAGLAIASLSLQLMDGVQRFQLFFEECRDPTIDIYDLVGQLNAVRHLCEIIEREATKTGSEGTLAWGASLHGELGKCKLRLQELTNLVMKFEASMPRLLTDQPRRKPRWKNYMKLHSQQKMIQKYATKLDRTRTTVLDHFHITVLDQLRTMQPLSSPADTNNSDDSGYCEKTADITDQHEQQHVLAPQMFKAPATTSTAHNNSIASRTYGSITFNHHDGQGFFNIGNTQSINTNSKEKITMFKQGGKKTKKATKNVPEQVVADASKRRGDAEQRGAELEQGIGETQDHHDYGMTVNTHSGEDTFFNKNNAQSVGNAQGPIVMFDQGGGDTDEE